MRGEWVLGVRKRDADSENKESGERTDGRKEHGRSWGRRRGMG
jgi:hypothetical protein